MEKNDSIGDNSFLQAYQNTLAAWFNRYSSKKSAEIKYFSELIIVKLRPYFDRVWVDEDLDFISFSGFDSIHSSGINYYHRFSILDLQKIKNKNSIDSFFEAFINGLEKEVDKIKCNPQKYSLLYYQGFNSSWPGTDAFCFNEKCSDKY